MIYNFSNLALGRLSVGIDATATAFAFADGYETWFPTDNFLVALWPRTAYATTDLAAVAGQLEFVHVAARSGVNCTGLTRAQENTAAINHNTAGQQYWALNVLPASFMNNLALGCFTCPDNSVRGRIVPRLVGTHPETGAPLYAFSFEPIS